MSAGRLALFGGDRALPAGRASRELVGWPVVTERERAAVLGVLDSGRFTSNDPRQGEVQLLEQEWADYVGTAHCAAIANATSALEIALAAADVEPGSEVLVPALSFIATAVAPVQRMLVPRFVDIDPETFTIDPLAVRAAIGPRTAAIIAVHLHGLPCDLTALRSIADEHGLLLIEDAAQSHAARYQGRRTGSLGDVAAFSLNVVKNLPTCGEGGLLTTDDEQLHRRILRRRQFGEDLGNRRTRDYLSHDLAGNAKLAAVQAAFTRGQLATLEQYHQARRHNVGALLERLAPLPGLRTPQCPPDRTHAWHILRFRIDAAALGAPDVRPGALRSVLERALRAEGVPVQPYQSLPLPMQPALRTRAGFGGYPWRLAGPAGYPPERAEDYPHTLAVLEDSFTLQRWHLNPNAGPVLQDCAAAFEKVWAHRDTVVAAARSVTYTPAWAEPDHSPAQVSR